jgi:hypothetical protein
VRCLIKPLPEHLRHGVARLVLEGKLFLPPDEEDAGIFLDNLIADVAVEIETEPMV